MREPGVPCSATSSFCTELYEPSFTHSKAITAANPPNTPAPNPVSFWCPTFELGAAVAALAFEDEVEEPALVLLVALPATAEDPEPPLAVGDDELPLAVVAPVAAALEPEVEELEVAVALEAHVTAEGRSVTPDVLQRFCANCTAVAWSAALHWAARQHAMSLRNVELEQMHLMSRDLQPPMLLPLVNLPTHDCC
jgi:hypothetical protein